MKKLLSNSLVAKDLLNFGTPSSLSLSFISCRLFSFTSIFSRPAPNPHHSFFIHKLISHSLSSITLCFLDFLKSVHSLQSQYKSIELSNKMMF
ncbi:hypothetical protein L2E82_40871 [Cichorium intybus]|uniref:Uncharacterized protein n=1 Tax=Cichorium intybus TaxID=13427 RepID=A0ACB9ALZ6_CICIN|nr:hypothetical protein L2E82_40871 [Cichorium intybus]